VELFTDAGIIEATAMAIRRRGRNVQNDLQTTAADLLQALG
jgi:hypothetical protein